MSWVDKVLTGKLVLAGGLTTLVAVYIARRGRLRSKASQLKISEGDSRKNGFADKKVPNQIDVIVVGSGISGLVCAATLAKHGQVVVVLEQHDVAGGCTHTFELKENGVTAEFDTGVHYIGGHIWESWAPNSKIIKWICGDNIQWQRMDNEYDIAIIGDHRYPMPAGRDALRARLVEWFPDETIAIDQYFASVQKQQDCAGPFFVGRLLRGLLPSCFTSLLRKLEEAHLRLSDISVKDMLTQAGCSAKLQGVLTYHWGNMGLPPASLSFASFAMMANHFFPGAAYPVGGSGVIAKRICAAIAACGGHVFVRAPVSRILTQQGRAVGVQLKNGKELFARRGIVSAAGAHITFGKLLCDHSFAMPEERASIENLPPSVQHIQVFACFQTTSGLPACNLWVSPGYDHDLDTTAHEGDEEQPFSAVFVSFPSCKDPTWQQRYPGTDTCHIVAGSSVERFAAWESKRVKHRGVEYESIKQNLTARLLEVVYREFPQLRERLIFADLGTPLSTQFYLGSRKGESYGLACTANRYRCEYVRPGTSITGLWLTGQDTISPGVMGAFISGYLTAMIVRPMTALSHINWLMKL